MTNIVDETDGVSLGGSAFNGGLGIARIEHAHSIGGQIADRHLWMMTINGHVYNYNKKSALIKEAEKDGFDWFVVRHHRNGTESIIERKAT